MKKINYFDLGLHHGQELDWFVDGVFPEQRIENYSIHGFEACEEYYLYCKEKYKSHPKATPLIAQKGARKNRDVNIHHLAISNVNTPIKLYYAEHEMGYSIFDTKDNIKQSKEFEEVQGIKFSDWLKENVPNFKEDVNIIKINIEGAEWHLINDIVENDIVKHFDLFFGTVDETVGPLDDVSKIGELKDKVPEFNKILKENNIIIHRLSEGYGFDHPNPNLRNCDLREVFAECLKKY
jgi:FkbM family methyltransferase